MRLRTALPMLAALVALSSDDAGAADRPTISLQQLEHMFASIRARTSWDVDGAMLWGYFFFDTSRERLVALGDHLAASGYRTVGIAPAGDGLLRLHVERVERHTPESLNDRNREFYGLADQFHVGSYDGMDVGPVQ